MWLKILNGADGDVQFCGRRPKTALTYKQAHFITDQSSQPGAMQNSVEPQTSRAVKS